MLLYEKEVFEILFLLCKNRIKMMNVFFLFTFTDFLHPALFTLETEEIRDIEIMYLFFLGNVLITSNLL